MIGTSFLLGCAWERAKVIFLTVWNCTVVKKIKWFRWVGPAEAGLPGCYAILGLLGSWQLWLASFACLQIEKLDGWKNCWNSHQGELLDRGRQLQMNNVGMTEICSTFKLSKFISISCFTYFPDKRLLRGHFLDVKFSKISSYCSL